MIAAIYNVKSEKVGEFELPGDFANLKWNSDLVHEVAESMRTNRRAGTAKTKTRGEVSGGGRKPWRQKGTGRARHGSIRSPIWVGGGVSHGPTGDKIYYRKINKKAAKKAFLTVLARKLRDQEILILDRLILGSPKTKEASGVLKALSRIPGFDRLGRKGVKIVIGAKETPVIRAFRNIDGVETMESRNLNILCALWARFMIFEKEDFIDMINRAKPTK